MGGTISNGRNNTELVDHLVDSGYIKSKKIEQVFRAVDRGDYFLSSHRQHAYRDMAWKHGNIHLSAPCIYCKVLEGLVLERGTSFLNIGSGTGYLSTMAGLLITKSGINHGIELHEDCVQYSYDRLDEFKQNSLAVDGFDFCDPVFIQGNCLSVSQGRQYDRVYCGATCPEIYEATIKEFVKIGGILVMPFKDSLLKMTRIKESEWTVVNMLPVSFATLIEPASKNEICSLPQCNPLLLQEICRANIRCILRDNIWAEHKDLEIRKPIIRSKQKMGENRESYIIPIFEDTDDSSDDDEENRPATRFTINLDGAASENIISTLQFVRSLLQSSRNDDNENNLIDDEDEDDEDDDDSLSSSISDISSSDSDNSSSTNHDSEPSGNSSNELKNHTKEEKMESVSSIADSTNEKVENQNLKQERKNNTNGRPLASSTASVIIPDYSSSSDDESSMEPSRKLFRTDQENGDSGILEDQSTSYDDATPSLSSDYANNCSGTSNTIDDNIAYNDNKNQCKSYSKSKGHTCSEPSQLNSKSPSSENSEKSSPRKRKESEEIASNGHYVDENAISQYMKEKIHQLPLPYALKFYINYNRAL